MAVYLRDGSAHGGVSQGWICSWRCISGIDLIMVVYLRDGSAYGGVSQGWICSWWCISGMDLLRQILCSATLRQKLQIKLSTSPSHSILTPAEPASALTLYYQAPGRVATGVPFFKSLVWLDLEKFHHSKRDSNPKHPALEVYAVTTWPTMQPLLVGSQRGQRWAEQVGCHWLAVISNCQQLSVVISNCQQLTGIISSCYW